jgi:hypothetical protein
VQSLETWSIKSTFHSLDPKLAKGDPYPQSCKMRDEVAMKYQLFGYDDDDDDDDEDIETLTQIYNTVLASMDLAKYQRTKSIFRWNELDYVRLEPKQRDNVSTSTASSDGTISHRDRVSSDEATSGLMNTKEMPPSIRGRFKVRLQKTWRALRGKKPYEALISDYKPHSQCLEPC